MPPPAPTSDPILDYVLLRFSEHDSLSVRDACQGVQIFGETGSGKTSGSGALLARSYLAAGLGGLVLTVKVDEIEVWRKYARETGRQDDLIVIGEGSNLRFNMLNYECQSDAGGLGLTRNLVELFIAIDEIVARERGRSGGASEQFWQNELRKIAANAVETLRLAGEEISFRNITSIILTAAHSREELADLMWSEESFCYKIIARIESLIDQKKLSHADVEDWKVTRDYWRNEFPTMPEETRANVVSSFTGLVDVFLRGMLREQFCTLSDVSLDDTFRGKIIVLNLPIKRFHDAGLIAQVVFKFIWQRAAERRTIRANTLPAFLWIDESQNFVSPREHSFLSTARGARICTVFLTQNLPNYYAQLGGDNKAEAIAQSMLGNLATKIFHNNGCIVTNRYATELFARTWQPKSSYSLAEDDDRYKLQEQTSIELLDQVIPHEFTILATGGPQNDELVEGIIHQGGRVFAASGTNYLKVVFPQNMTS